MKNSLLLGLFITLFTITSHAATFGTYAYGSLYDSDGGEVVQPLTNGGSDTSFASVSGSGSHAWEYQPNIPVQYSYNAQASVDTTSMTPVLRSVSTFDTDNMGNYFVSAYASAFQSYQYTGLDSRTIAIDLSLHANLSEYYGHPSGANGMGSYINAYFGIFSGFEAVTEACGTEISGLNLYACGDVLGESFTRAYDIGGPGINNNGDYTQTNTIYIDVNPGDTFLIYANLDARTHGGFADASRTFNMTFDDTSNITALTASPVPVPAALWLFGSGLIGLLFVGRTRA